MMGRELTMGESYSLVKGKGDRASCNVDVENNVLYSACFLYKLVEG